MASLDDLLRSSERQHLMLLYDDEGDRSAAEIESINNALSAGWYCVYATVDANDKDFASKLSMRISDYDRHAEEGNLLVLNFMPFYDSAADGDLTLFKQMKAEVEETLKARTALGKEGKALLVADAACHLAKHKQFDECVTLEGWWQETYNDWLAKNLDITIICAHPSSVLNQRPHVGEKGRISQSHSLTLDLNDFMQKSQSRKVNEVQSIRILVVEPESDIRLLYRRYLHSMPVDLVTVAGGRECLEQAVTPHKRSLYDVIIIDTHIKDSSGFHIAKKILEENPDQQIIFTTTWDPETIGSDLKAHSLESSKYPVLHKPFMFSSLLGFVRPAKFRMHQ